VEDVKLHAMETISRLLLSCLILISGCSLFGEPANTSPSAGLSKAMLQASCLNKANGVAKQWLACTAESQAEFVCDQIANGGELDTAILALLKQLNAVVPDPQLNAILAGGVPATNAALGEWCSIEGHGPAK
jgi:hypothetical protein